MLEEITPLPIPLITPPVTRIYFILPFLRNTIGQIYLFKNILIFPYS